MRTLLLLLFIAGFAFGDSLENQFKIEKSSEYDEKAYTFHTKYIKPNFTVVKGTDEAPYTLIKIDESKKLLIVFTEDFPKIELVFKSDTGLHYLYTLNIKPKERPFSPFVN